MIPDPIFKHVDELCVMSGKDDHDLYHREMDARKWHKKWSKSDITKHVKKRIESIDKIDNKVPLRMLGERFGNDEHGFARTCSAALGDFIAANWYRDPYIAANMAGASRRSLSTSMIEKVAGSGFFIPFKNHYHFVSTFLARDIITSKIIDNDRDMDVRKHGMEDYIVMLSNFVSNFGKDDGDAISVLEQYYPIDDSIEISAISRSIPVPAASQRSREDCNLDPRLS